ncbi:Hypothetical predicted protein [Podarcis lilfordi]|uniref:Uncharacterized protein n=1 Tax=Podarcis lilfordi TaxID=74358 RepID=A0AA35PQG1_9SAUR|nr:Hypothetical predicted protein [Podarcis lilfordi]
MDCICLAVVGGASAASPPPPPAAAAAASGRAGSAWEAPCLGLPRILPRSRSGLGSSHFSLPGVGKGGPEPFLCLIGAVFRPRLARSKDKARP